MIFLNSYWKQSSSYLFELRFIPTPEGSRFARLLRFASQRGIYDKIKSIPDLVSELKTKNLDIIYLGRETFNRCPTFQTYTEQAGNWYYGDFLNLYWDYFFGSIIWKREYSNYFLDFKEKVPEASWDIHIIAPLIAKKDGKKVEQVKIDFTYPKEMKDEEEGSTEFNLKRISQLQIMTEAITKYPELKFN